MIEINLLPSAGRKAGRRSRGGPDVRALAAAVTARVKDPFLAGAVAAVLLGVAGTGALHLRYTARADDLAGREMQAVQDSTRYHAILAEKVTAEAQRDSIVQQLAIIRSIDNDRYVWPHIMEEVSRALPPFTWLTSVNQTSAIVSVAARPDSAALAANGTPVDSAALAAAAAAPPPPLQFRIVGHTVDIQALTRFMKLLEASPFVQRVQLARTDAAAVDGKQVTEFQLDAEYELPAPSAVRMVPVTLSVR